MHGQVGVVREARGLAATLDWIEAAIAQCRPRRAPLIAARLIAAGALARQESRGGHYRSDFPEHARAASHLHPPGRGRPAPDPAFRHRGRSLT